MCQPDDVTSLAVKIRKFEARLATIEECLGTPANAGKLEKRLGALEDKAGLNPDSVLLCGSQAHTRWTFPLASVNRPCRGAGS